jgi:hypothetical protein
MALKRRQITPDEERRLMAAKKEIGDVLKRACDNHGLSGMELLGLMAFMTGSAMAFQDQRKVTAEMCWELIAANIEAGNAQAMMAVTSVEGRPN